MPLLHGVLSSTLQSPMNHAKGEKICYNTKVTGALLNVHAVVCDLLSASLDLKG